MTHDIAMLAIDPPMCLRQRRLQCSLQCSPETRLRTDLWYSTCYFYSPTKQSCQAIQVLVKAMANWNMALMGTCLNPHVLTMRMTRQGMLATTAHRMRRALSVRRRPDYRSDARHGLVYVRAMLQCNTR